MAMRIDGKRVQALRLDGVNLLARVDGAVAHSAGLRSLVEEWEGWTPGRWLQRSDPANETALATLGTGPSRIVAGVPAALWSGKPSSTTFTQQEYMNEVGTWETVSATRGTVGSLYTGIVLGTDAQASRMLVVEWELNEIALRYRTSISNSWINIGRTTSFSHQSGDTIRAVRTREGTGHRVRVYQNDVLRGNWVDNTGIPGSPGMERIGVRLQGDRGWGGAEYSPSIDRFTFTAG